MYTVSLKPGRVVLRHTLDRVKSAFSSILTRGCWQTPPTTHPSVHQTSFMTVSSIYQTMWPRWTFKVSSSHCVKVDEATEHISLSYWRHLRATISKVMMCFEHAYSLPSEFDNSSAHAYVLSLFVNCHCFINYCIISTE